MSKNKERFVNKPIIKEEPEVVETIFEEVEEPAIEEVEEVVVEQQEEKIITKSVKSGTRLRVRKAPKVEDNNVIRELKPDSEVNVYEEINGWARISKDQSEYVMTEFLV